MYGMWPVEIKIEAAPVADKKKEKSNKSFITTGGNLVKGPKPVDTSGVTLPIHQLALVELSDLLYPGLTQSRVLATFIPNPTEEILRCRTGMEKLAYTIGADAQNVSTISTNTGKKRSDAPINSDDPIKDIKTVKSLFQVGGPVPPAFVEKPEKPSEEYATDVNENFPADPFCIIVHLEFSRALTEKPEQETLLLELNNVINVKQLYKSDPSRRAEKTTLDQFEKAIAKVSHMFYAEYEDYVKLRTRVEHDKMDKSKTMLDNEKTNKTITEPTNETEAVEQPWNNLSETRTCDTTHANKHKLRSNQTVNNNEPDMEAFGDQCRMSKTENDSTSHELLALPQIHISIPVDFREYLIRSGSLAKAFTLLELPLREYICFYYKPDGNETHLGVDYMTLYSMEVLADIHAQVNNSS
uniref:Uncharacterized protein n=1 Tax=Cacopsylla melanoneura TaxID=428564 RepID=A0A8D9E9A8_9HEMI